MTCSKLLMLKWTKILQMIYRNAMHVESSCYDSMLQVRGLFSQWMPLALKCPLVADVDVSSVRLSSVHADLFLTSDWTYHRQTVGWWYFPWPTSSSVWHKLLTGIVHEWLQLNFEVHILLCIWPFGIFHEMHPDKSHCQSNIFQAFPWQWSYHGITSDRSDKSGVAIQNSLRNGVATSWRRWRTQWWGDIDSPNGNECIELLTW